MSFNIDNQSYKDLNIFTNDSIFNMFKGTRTVGARDMLNEMMQNPSSDIQYITSRRDSIRYFYDHKLELEIREEQMLKMHLMLPF